MLNLEVNQKVKLPKTKSAGYGYEYSPAIRLAKENKQDYLYFSYMTSYEGENGYILTHKFGFGGDFFLEEDIEIYENNKVETIIEGNYKFIINEPTVICIITDKENNKWFKGIAKCLTTDEFDQQRGMSIALLKAKIKQCQYYLKELTK